MLKEYAEVLRFQYCLVENDGPVRDLQFAALAADDVIPLPYPDVQLMLKLCAVDQEVAHRLHFIGLACLFNDHVGDKVPRA